MNFRFYSAPEVVHRAVVGIGWLALAGGAYAQVTIQSITSSIQGGTEMVRIDLSEPLNAVPAGFAVQSPARIALDFPGVVNGLNQSAVELNQGNLRAANVA